MGNSPSCEVPEAVVTTAEVVNDKTDLESLKKMLKYSTWRVQDLNNKQTKAFFKRWTAGYMRDWNRDFVPLNDLDRKEYISENFNAMRLPPRSPHEKNLRLYSHCKSKCHPFKTFQVVIVDLQGSRVAYIIKDKKFSFIESNEIDPPAEDPPKCKRVKPGSDD